MNEKQKQLRDLFKNMDPDRYQEIRGVLNGIKGQYLLLSSGVLNIRKFGGYEVTFEV